MCGRYAADADKARLVEELGIQDVTPDGEQATVPRYNIAPTTAVPAVLERLDDEDEAVRTLVSLRWGLVPSWAKDTSRAGSLINARAETVSEKPSFRTAFRRRRCILPALGYYEWQAAPGGGPKQPWFLRPGDGSLLLMAGLYEFWKGPDGWLATTAVITTSATDETGWLHDRMPMQVTDVDAWLDHSMENPETAAHLMEAPLHLEPVRVSRAVGNVRNEGPHLIAPAAGE